MGIASAIKNIERTLRDKENLVAVLHERPTLGNALDRYEARGYCQALRYALMEVKAARKRKRR